jgi:hypothetical protein
VGLGQGNGKDGRKEGTGGLRKIRMSIELSTNCGEVKVAEHAHQLGMISSGVFGGEERCLCRLKGGTPMIWDLALRWDMTQEVQGSSYIKGRWARDADFIMHAMLLYILLGIMVRLHFIYCFLIFTRMCILKAPSMFPIIV